MLVSVPSIVDRTYAPRKRNVETTDQADQLRRLDRECVGVHVVGNFARDYKHTHTHTHTHRLL